MLILTMQLDKFTDYALRVLVTLAVREPERVSASSIAQTFGLSEHHLAKVASQLVPAADINIGAVVRALKIDSPVVECFGNNHSCRIMPACGLRTPLQEAQEAFFGALDRYTLADVTQSQKLLAELLVPL